MKTTPAIVIACASLAATAAADGTAENQAREQLERRGRYLAWSIAHDSQYGVFLGDATPLHAIVRQAASEDDVVAVVVRDSRGTILASHGAVALPKETPAGITVAVAEAAGGERLLLVGSPVPITAAEDGAPLGDVHVALSLRHMDAREQLDRLGRFIAADLARESAYALSLEDQPRLASLAQAVPTGGDRIDAVVIRNGRGRVVASAGLLTSLPASMAGKPTQRDVETLAGETVALFSAPVRGDGRLDGDVHVALSLRGLAQ